MIDRYEPLLSKFYLTRLEQKAITKALTSEDPWGWGTGPTQKRIIKRIKDKIRKFHLSRHNDKCCYCRTNLYGEAMLSIDREHIIPKGRPIYKFLSYEIWNLAAACKRCNMKYKGQKIDFLIDQKNYSLFEKSSNYRLIHPNFDLYKEHLKRSAKEEDENVIVKYIVVGNSPKGNYTYDYFDLRGLEINTFDQDQLLEAATELGETAQKVRERAKKFGQ